MIKTRHLYYFIKHPLTQILLLLRNYLECFRHVLQSGRGEDGPCVAVTADRHLLHRNLEKFEPGKFCSAFQCTFTNPFSHRFGILVPYLWSARYWMNVKCERLTKKLMVK